MRKKIAAGNWKMNLSLLQAQTLVSEIMQMTKDEYMGSGEVIFAPSFPYLSSVKHFIKDDARFHLSAQNVHQAEGGAFTGECSATMLKSVGVSHCIIGHSERRQYFSEGGSLLAEKINICLKYEIIPIYCIGETLAERQGEQTLSVIESQISSEIFHLSPEDFGKIIIAYEPVWAIGTGMTASPEQAEEVHAYVRSLLKAKYGEELAENCSILYGGSVSASNAKTLFSQPNIDGGLVGGASLKSRDFTEIIKALG